MVQIVREVFQRGGGNATGKENDEIAGHAVERIVELPLEEVGEHEEEDEARDERGVHEQVVEERLGG